MHTRAFAGVLGAVYTVVGALGFVPRVLGIPAADAPPLAIDAAYGYLLHLFPVNALHSVIHLAVGVAGLASASALYSALMYARVTAVLFGALSVMGLIPRLDTLFGLVPLFGHDVWLHALTALAAGYFAVRRWALVEAIREHEHGRRAA